MVASSRWPGTKLATVMVMRRWLVVVMFVALCGVPASYAQRLQASPARPTLLERARNLFRRPAPPVRNARRTDAVGALARRGMSRRRALRLGRALEVAGLEAAALSNAAVKALRAADAALASGHMSAAIRSFDRLGLGAEGRTLIEEALAREHGVTPVQVYRSPHALGPKGEILAPDYHGVVYHGTTRVSPREMVRHGLRARGRSLSLEDHVLANGEDSAFRGATLVLASPTRDSGALLWAGAGGWVYEIEGVPSWDVNKHLDGRIQRSGLSVRNPVRQEQEHAVLGHVPPERVRRYGRVVAHPRTGHLMVEQWFDNPKFVGAGSAVD